EHLSSLILGSKSGTDTAKLDIPKGAILLEVKNLTYSKDTAIFLDINFHLRKNEILVITGIRENGLETLENILSGSINRTTGDIAYKNKPTGNNLFNLRKIGAGYIPSDRIKKGTSISSSITDNIILLKYKFLSKWGILKNKNTNNFSSKLIDKFSINGSGNQLISTLSGGNIQRVMIAREMDAEPELLIFAEPSRGLDISSKQMIYQKINNLKKKGSGILVISSDIDEAINIADRILILHNGKEAATLINKNIDRSIIGKIMLGLDN
ncbi:MAG: ATP-binding cassette domain-containing protein, partial [Spirochaetia bacterium]|nr:ATP-binding cassette domain-containing protein [Spirochaetia bacterium]